MMKVNTTTTENSNMTIVIREKEEVSVLDSDRHAQIEQMQISLKNYVQLYNESQAKLAEAERQIEIYQQEIKKIS